MSSLSSRLPIYFVGFPLTIWIILTGGILFYLFVGFFTIMAFIEFLSLKREEANSVLWWVLGMVYVCLSLSCLFLLRDIDNQLSSYFTLMLFCGVMLNDTFAYIFGNLIGGRKIAPSISPNKTYAGLLGGVIGSTIFTLLFSYYVFSLKMIDILIFIFIFSVVGFFGDLLESYLKRSVNVKDSSNLLMGHGGALDRLDSLILTSPPTLLYVIGQYLL